MSKTFAKPYYMKIWAKDKYTAININKKEINTQEKQTSSAELKLTAQVTISSHEKTKERTF